MTRLLSILFVFSLITGCGFQLKGHSDVNPISIEAINIVFSEADSPLKTSLRANTARHNIRLDKSAAITVNIGNVTFLNRNLSLARKNETFERELQASVRVSIDNGTLTIENFSRSIVYSHDPLAVLSSERDQQLQRQDLMQQLAEHILLRVENLSPR